MIADYLIAHAPKLVYWVGAQSPVTLTLVAIGIVAAMVVAYNMIRELSSITDDEPFDPSWMDARSCE